jgi:hypothetical protein
MALSATTGRANRTIWHPICANLVPPPALTFA